MHIAWLILWIINKIAETLEQLQDLINNAKWTIKLTLKQQYLQQL
jgi:sugar-specific transcriptional regulator TrmB